MSVEMFSTFVTDSLCHSCSMQPSYMFQEPVSRNKKKKSAFMKFFMSTGLNKQKQLVSLEDIYYLGTDSQNESIINGDEEVRSSFLYALIKKEKLDDSL